MIAWMTAFGQLSFGPAEWQALRVSLEVSALSTCLVALPGTGLGLLLGRCQFRGKLILDALIHLPLVLTPVVVGLLLLMALGREGLLGIDIAYTRSAAVLASAVIALPLVVRSVRTAAELVDDRLLEAAAVLGAGPVRRFWEVLLPLSRPGIAAGLTLGFARSLGEFGATITFAGNFPGETRTLPAAIYTASQTPGGDGSAMALTLASVALSFLALLGSEWWMRRSRGRGQR